MDGLAPALRHIYLSARRLGRMATILKIVGGNIRRLRKSKRLTLEQLAEKAESNPKYLGAVERGEENIGLNKLAQVAAALRVDPYELLLEEKVSLPRN